MCLTSRLSCIRSLPWNTKNVNTAHPLRGKQKHAATPRLTWCFSPVLLWLVVFVPFPPPGTLPRGVPSTLLVRVMSEAVNARCAVSTGKLRPNVSAGVPAYDPQQGHNRMGGTWWNMVEQWKIFKASNMGRSFEVYMWYEVDSQRLFGQFWFKNMAEIRKCPNKTFKIIQIMQYKCASKLVNATSTCSDVKGDFVRPFQVMRRRLFQNLQRTTRSAQAKQLDTFLACRVKEDHDGAVNSECHVISRAYLAQSARNVAGKRKPAPDGFWQSKSLFHKICQSFGMVMNHFLRNWIPYPMATIGICKRWHDVHLNLNIFGEVCDQTKSSTAHWDRNTWR